MARPLPNNTLLIQKLSFLPSPLAFFIILSAVFSVISMLTFLCGSPRGVLKSLRGKADKKTVRLGGENKAVIKKMKSSLSSKARLMAKMISWRKVQDGGEEHKFDHEEEENGDEDGVVWKKTIIKGEKCRPIDFSGKILYDSEGNLLQD